MIKVIIPAYNEGPYIFDNVKKVDGILRGAGIEHGFFLVDDGSKDQTWNEMNKLKAELGNVEAIRFSRNYGKEHALAAAMDNVDADAVVIMDSDLQHPPEYIPEMEKLWREGYEVVDGVKADRGRESLLYKLFALTFYRSFNASTGMDLSSASDFKLLDRKAVEAWRLFPERATFFRGISALSGFKRTSLPFKVAERSGGTSKWTFKNLVKLAVGSVAAYSSAPLLLPLFSGAAFIAASIVMALLAIFKKAPVFTVLFAVFLAGGAVLVSLGVVGLYISKMYDEIKGRPRYIISERI